MSSEDRKNNKSILYQIESLVVAFIIAMILRQFVIASYKIPTGSMENTLLVGDFLLGVKFLWGAPIPFTHDKFPSFQDIKRGDIVIFKSPIPPYYEFIKRCVAVAGDTVVYKNKKLYVNENFIINPPEGGNRDPRIISFRDNFGPYIVPKRGDTIYNDSLNFRKFVFFKNLYFQDYPYKKLKTKYTFLIKGEETTEFVFSNGNIVNLNNFSLDTINWYFVDELLDDIKQDLNSDSVYIKSLLYANGEKIDKYVVRSNCYFMMGDNRDFSLDSRFWGYVSYRSVLAKPLIIYFSLSSDITKSFFERIRWSRIGRLIN